MVFILEWKWFLIFNSQEITHFAQTRESSFLHFISLTWLSDQLNWSATKKK